MTDKNNFGPTGDYPDGKLAPHDEGALQMGVAHDDNGYVHLNFGKPIMALALPQENAINLARLILKHCGVSRVEIEL